MAVIDYTTDTPSGTQGMYVANWSGLGDGDVGNYLAYSNLADKTVHVFGDTIGTVTIQGSNDPRVVTDPDNADWQTLVDNFGGSLVFSISGISVIAQAPRYIRPSCIDSDNASVIILSNAS